MWELMLQAGPVGKAAHSMGFPIFLIQPFLVNVHLPKDRISMAHQGYGFCELLTEEDAEYACKIMNQIKLWGKPIRVNKVRRRIPSLRWCNLWNGVLASMEPLAVSFISAS